MFKSPNLIHTYVTEGPKGNFLSFVFVIRLFSHSAVFEPDDVESPPDLQQGLGQDSSILLRMLCNDDPQFKFFQPNNCLNNCIFLLKISNNSIAGAAGKNSAIFHR